MNATTPLIRFLAFFFAVFFVTAAVLFAIDFYPEKKAPRELQEDTTGTIGDTAAASVGEAPTRVVIPEIGVDTLISNPTSFDIPTLDNELLKGAVRYPGSALLGENAPVFLFGHQSYLPVVRNPAFKAFNGLQKLEAGDAILVHSDTGVYEYRVRSVSLVDAKNALIPLEDGERRLVLSTCNSFGSPGERYVVSAEYVSRAALH